MHGKCPDPLYAEIEILIEANLSISVKQIVYTVFIIDQDFRD